MAAKRTRPWFAVKRLGYGVGLPIAWQGWLVLVIYLAGAVCAALLFPPVASAVALILSTAALLWICYIKSDEEWRWRKGE